MKVEFGIPPEEWNEQLKSLGGHFLQSRAWALFQQQLGRQTVYFADKNWLGLGILRSTRGFNYLDFHYGPTLPDDSALSVFIKNIQDFCKTNKIDFVRVEPQILKNGQLPPELIRVTENQPALTNILDITLRDEDLLAKVSSGHRYDIRHAQLRDLNVEFSQDEKDIELFLDMHHDTIERAKIKSFPDQYYHDLAKSLFRDDSAFLAIARSANKPVASAIIFKFNDTAYYAFGSAYQEINRKLHGAVYLIWEIILKCKQEGISKFDFWGVAPQDQPYHRWAGLSYFKRAFGGTDKIYLGTYELPINKLKYFTYSQIKKLKK